jgi:hypothetical protein
MYFMSSLSGKRCLLTPVIDFIGLKFFCKNYSVGIFFIFFGKDELLIRYRIEVF